MKAESKFEIELELTTRCNLACTYCLRTVLPRRPKKDLTLHEVKRILRPDNISAVATVVHCGELGEPTLNKEIIPIIDYLYEIKPTIGQLLHTNGCARSRHFWKDLSRFSELVVSWNIDGLADTNHLYRQGADWEKIMTNFDTFLARHNRSFWRYIIFDWNAHQVEAAERVAESKAIPFQAKRNAEFVRHYQAQQNRCLQLSRGHDDTYKFRCHRLYIDASGMVSPCCFFNIAYLKHDPAFSSILAFYDKKKKALDARENDYRDILKRFHMDTDMKICDVMCNPFFKEWEENYRYPYRRSARVNALHRKIGGQETELKLL